MQHDGFVMRALFTRRGRHEVGQLAAQRHQGRVAARQRLMRGDADIGKGAGSDGGGIGGGVADQLQDQLVPGQKHLTRKGVAVGGMGRAGKAGQGRSK